MWLPSIAPITFLVTCVQTPAGGEGPTRAEGEGGSRERSDESVYLSKGYFMEARGRESCR